MASSLVMVPLAILFVLFACAAQEPQDGLTISSEMPPVLEVLAATLMQGEDVERRPCSFVTGEQGSCVPFFNCVDTETIMGDGSCGRLTVCCRTSFIYEVPKETDQGSDKDQGSNKEQEGDLLAVTGPVVEIMGGEDPPVAAVEANAGDSPPTVE